MTSNFRGSNFPCSLRDTSSPLSDDNNDSVKDTSSPLSDDNNDSVKDTSSPLSDDNSSPNASILPLTDDNSSPKGYNTLSESTEESFDGSFDFPVDHDGISSVHSTPKQEKLAIQLDSPGGTNLGTYNLTPNSRENFRKVLGEQRAKDNIQ